MKLLCMVLVTALSLLAFNVKGQSPAGSVPSPLPQFLPIGSNQRMFDWAVTNRYCDVDFQLTGTNFDGYYVTAERFTYRLKFDTYASFMQKLVNSSISNLVSLKKQANMDYSGIVRFFALVSITENDRNTLVFNVTNIGRLGNINSDTFSCLVPTSVNTVVDIPSIQKITLFVPSSKTYSNQWSGSTWSTNQPTGCPSEVATTNLIGLNQWSWNGSYPGGRITITAGGKTMTYTGYGDPILPPVFTLSRDLKLTLK
ncbi:MAG: hypothetical protein RL536_551, partial [Candidatus Parcubacteria bacterium]